MSDLFNYAPLLGMFFGTWGIVCLGLIILQIAIYWRLFTKAGQQGWACLIPIYNVYIMLKIGNRPGYWLLLMLIPLVNVILSLVALASFIEAYGKSRISSFLLALFFPVIYFAYLAFSKDVEYVGLINN